MAGYYTITQKILSKCNFQLNLLKSKNHTIIELSEPEIIIEKLLEQRDFYLNTLKHLDFELIMDPTEKEIENIKKLETTTIEQIKKVEQEIAFLKSKTS